MAEGILGWIHNNISGDQSRDTPNPGLFKAGTVGALWGHYLKSLYKVPTGESSQFRNQSMALRDALSMESDAQKDEFGNAINTGGFYDSGARLTGVNDINRSKMASYSQGLSAILAKLEADKMQAAFPYLQMQLGEYSAHQAAIAKAQDEQNFRGAQLGQGISGAFSGGGGSGGGGSSGGYTMTGTGGGEASGT